MSVNTSRTSKTTAHNLTRSLKNNQPLTAKNPGYILTATTISFTSADTIADSGNGLAAFLPDTTIRVSGNTANARDYVVATSAAGSLTVFPAFVTTESAGEEITIQQVV